VNKKLEEKNKKLEEKNKKIEEKNKLKMELIEKKTEVNINSTNYNQFCKAILKSGKNKGTQCFANTYKDCLCKRHYVLGCKDYANNTIIEENIVIDKDIKI
jgi:hypothetical protein